MRSSGPAGMKNGDLKTNEAAILDRGGFLKKFSSQPKQGNAINGTKVVMAPKRVVDDEDDFEIDFGDAKPKL